MSYLKIGLIGCAGGGRSSVAREISKELSLPFLSSKDITRPFLQRYGYVYGEDNYVEKFLGQKTIEFQIVEKRLEEELMLSGGFVSDRTSVECFCYSFLSLCTYKPDDFSLLESMCRESISSYTHLFYFPFKGVWFEDNGLRTINASLQWEIDILIRGIISDWNLDVISIPLEFMHNKSVDRFIIQEIKKSDK